MKKIILIGAIIFHFCVFAQKGFVSGDPFKTDYFIENKGQFDRYKTGDRAILYGIDHACQQLFFYDRGYDIYLSYTIVTDSMLKAFESTSIFNRTPPNAHPEKQKTPRIQQEWLGRNTEIKLDAQEKSGHYFSYGDSSYQCYGYKKIRLNNFYTQIDLEYTLAPQGGIKYSLYLHPGANLSDIQFKYFGEGVQVKVYPDSIRINHRQYEYIEKDLIVYDQFKQPMHMSYYTRPDGHIGIQSEKPLNPTISYTIDPWVGACTTLTSTISILGKLNKNKGLAVAYDNVGNLFVYGGGGYAIMGATSAHNQKIAKYNLLGILQWTFMGSIPSISWETSYFTGELGTFNVLKENSKIVIGNGSPNWFIYPNGGISVRLNSNGIYDNYKTNKHLSIATVSHFDQNCNSKIITIHGSTYNDTSNYLSATIDNNANLHPINDIHKFNPINFSPFSLAFAKNQRGTS